MTSSPSKIYLYSLSRTGSTVVWQVLRYLFPEAILSKRHSPPTKEWDGSYPIVMTYRDPRDRLASQYRKGRIGTVPLTNKNYLDRLLEQSDVKFQEFRQFVEKHGQNSQCLLLCYEQFYEDFDHLIDRLTNFFQIDITDAQREHIKSTFNVERNLEIASKLHNFHQLDNESQIHGNHISPLYKGEPMSWTKVIDVSLHKYLMKQIKGELQFYSTL